MLEFLKSLKHIRKVYSDYETAYANSDPKAYQAEEIIEVVFQKTLKFKENLKKGILEISPTISNAFCSIMLVLLEKEKKEIKLIDFGGACGALYFQTRNFFPSDTIIRWAVIETPAMVNKAKKLSNEELSFWCDLNEAITFLGTPDIFYTSGTIQALDKPREYLQKMVNIKSDYVFFNRVGVHKGKGDLFTVHSSKLSWNGPGKLPSGFKDKWVKYPFCFMEEKFFLDTIQQNYQIIAKFEDRSGMYPIFGYSIDGYAVLCKLK